MATRNGNRHNKIGQPFQVSSPAVPWPGEGLLFPTLAPQIVYYVLCTRETGIARLRVRNPIGGRGVVGKRPEMASCWTFCVCVASPTVDQRMKCGGLLSRLRQ
jgi:hypothetical protein